MQAPGDAGNSWGSYYRSFTGGGGGGGGGKGEDPVEGNREPGTRRKKIAGYLKAANDLRQSYYSGYQNRATEMGGGEYNVGTDQSSGSWPDMEVASNGDEELVLFPSYARRRPDEDNMVDVEIRGWLFAPHSGPLSRKNRYLHWVALKLCGLPAQASSQPGEPDGGPTAAEAEAAKEAAAAIEKNGRPPSLYSSDSRMGTLSRANSAPLGAVAVAAAKTLSWRPAMVTSTSTQSLPQVPQLDPAEVSSAHAALATRLAPFMHRPIPNARITIVFSDKSSRSSQEFTVFTSETGHFAFQEDLSFIPTTVSVIALEKITASEDVIIHEPTGISLISDIDDTVKHSAVSMGAREIFRNTFTEPLSKLSIPGVSGWYKRLSQEPYNVNFHYVSNSPWQLYPVLKSFFEESGLPPGSMHLKEYSGMLQGIFEPVAERKKGTVERVIRDFPQRQWILVGDSGEADLEVYTEIVEKFPGRILAVFIRDVTTTLAPEEKEFFNPNESPEYAKAMQEWAEAKAASVKQPKIPPPLPPKRRPVSYTAAQSQPEELSRETPVEGAKTLPPRTPKPTSLRDTMVAPAAKSSSTTDLLCTRNSPPPPPPPRRVATPSSGGVPSIVLPSPGLVQHPATTASLSPAPMTPRQQQQQAQQEVLLSKREELWNRRWERALMIMGHYDVQLHSWRTGGDVEAMCRAIVEKALWE